MNAWLSGKHLSRCDQVIKKAAKNLRRVIAELMGVSLQVDIVVETNVKSNKMRVLVAVWCGKSCLYLTMRVLDDYASKHPFFNKIVFWCVFNPYSKAKVW